jgi:hypothetical protein
VIQRFCRFGAPYEPWADDQLTASYLCCISSARKTMPWGIAGKHQFSNRAKGFLTSSTIDETKAFEKQPVRWDAVAVAAGRMPGIMIASLASKPLDVSQPINYHDHLQPIYQRMLWVLHPYGVDGKAGEGVLWLADVGRDLEVCWWKASHPRPQTPRSAPVSDPLERIHLSALL